MATRNVSFPTAAAGAFGSRRTTHADFPSEARDAFSKKPRALGGPSLEFPDAFAHHSRSNTDTRTAFNDAAASAFGSSQGRQSRDFGADTRTAFNDAAASAFGAGQGRLTRDFGADASAAFGKDRGNTSASSGGFDDRASQAFGKKPKRSDMISMSQAIPRGNTMGAHFTAFLGDSPAVVGRAGSALFKKKEVAPPVLTQEEMFPALRSTTTTVQPQKAPVAKMSFADLARKRAQEDEEERLRAEQEAAARQLEVKRAEREQSRLRAIHNIRMFGKKTIASAEEEEEEFYDEGEAYIRPEDVEDQYHDRAEEQQDGEW